MQKKGLMVWKVIYLLWLIFVALFFLDIFTTLDIKNPIVNTLVYLVAAIGMPCIFGLVLFKCESTTTKIMGTALPVAFAIFIVANNPVRYIISAMSTWKTQTILYQNGHLPFKKVEFQMMNTGVGSYKRRTVEVHYITPWFMVTSTPEPNLDKHVEWVKVDQDVNEMGLKQ